MTRVESIKGFFFGNIYEIHIVLRLQMKEKGDHCSKFSNLSNWKEEAWEISGLQRDSNP